MNFANKFKLIIYSLGNLVLVFLELWRGVHHKRLLSCLRGIHSIEAQSQPAFWKKRVTKNMHTFIKVGGRLKGERLSYLSMYLLYTVFLSFSMLPRLHFILHFKKCKHAMCFTNPIYIFFYFLVSLSLTASFQNSLKTSINLHKTAYKMSKKLSAGVRWRKRRGRRGRRDRVDSTLHHGCWGDRRP